MDVLPVELRQEISGRSDPSTQFVLRFVSRPWRDDSSPPIRQTEIVKAATAAGYLDVIKWLTDSLGWPVPTYTPFIETAAQYGRKDVVKWGFERGAFWQYTLNWAAKRGDKELLDLAADYGCDLSKHLSCAKLAAKGHFEILKWARSIGCEWDHEASESAAKSGNLELFKWVEANGCERSYSVLNSAAKKGNLEMIQWLRATGSKWTREITDLAAINGHLDVIIWARENGCKWGNKVYQNAAWGGHLDVLKYALANGCPLPESEYSICLSAAEGGQLDVLKWARSNGFSWNSVVRSKAASGGHTELLEWTVENGCPNSSERNSKRMKRNNDDIDSHNNS